MKTIIYILIFNLSAISFAQDPRLFENSWFLHSITIGNIDYYPPNLEPISFQENVFTENPFVLYTGYCDSVASLVTYDNPNRTFLLEDYPTIVPGSSCSFTGNFIYNNQYFSILYAPGMLAKNPFLYTITTDGNNKALLITNPDGDQALYGNAPLEVKDFDTNILSIHPNPAKNELFLSSKNGAGKVNFKIFNIEGKLLRTEDLNLDKQASMDVSNLSSGIYFLNLSDENGNLAVKKFIKE